MPTFTALAPIAAPLSEHSRITERAASSTPVPVHSFTVRRGRLECLRMVSAMLRQLDARPTIIGDSKVIGALRQCGNKSATVIEISVERLSLNLSIITFSNLTPISTVDEWSVARHCLAQLRSSLMCA
ncbi:MAG TPA: hypothetical protein V6C72_03340 [Chroococcales cyanobacterium]